MVRHSKAKGTVFFNDESGYFVMLRLHCEVRQTGQNNYEGVCLENSVASFASDPSHAINKLKMALDIYCADLGEEMSRLVAEGQLDPRNDNAVRSELSRYMQKVSYYPWRRFLWHTRQILQSARTKEVPTFITERSVRIA
jgi:hypothetical protein